MIFKDNNKKVYERIKLLTDRQQIWVLEQCLDPKNMLSDIFWAQRGVAPCSLERGTLKEMRHHLVDLKHSGKIVWALQAIELVKQEILSPDLFFMITSMIFGTDPNKAKEILLIQHTNLMNIAIRNRNALSWANT